MGSPLDVPALGGLMNADPTTDPGALLLDSALPDFPFARLECAAVAAAPPTVYEAARDLDLLSIHSPLFDAVTWARGLPERLRGPTTPIPPSMRVADLFDLTTQHEQDQPWVALGENPGRELVFGAVGKVWRPRIEWRRVESEEFTDFNEPGWAKMAAAFVVHSYGTQRSLLTYEARTACTDAKSNARFGRYWTLVTAGVGLVLRGTLQAVKETAEQAARSGVSSTPSGGGYAT